MIHSSVRTIPILVSAILGLTTTALAQVATSPSPVVLGYAIGLFKIGSELFTEDFKNLENWVVQIQPKTGFSDPKVEVQNNTLECVLPGRGCTIWLKRKLQPRITITYDVICPTPSPAIKGVEPRDINNFWMASDPLDPHRGLFDSARYNGAFKSYDKMHAYYASTGGGSLGAANLTTRMRRYPRQVVGEPSEHIALNDKDERPGYLITPDKVMRIQLVAYDDVVQYIVDGKLVYQIKQGDNIPLEGRDNEGKPTTREALNDPARFSVYTEGYFGFRMVGTHHIYSNFRIHSLEPDGLSEVTRHVTPSSRTPIRVSSLEALREVISRSNQVIVLAPGRYQVTDRNGFQFTGSNNDITLSGASIEIPMEIASGNSLFKLSGNHITIRGGVLEDTYPDGNNQITDYGSYNQRKKLGGMNEVVVTGDDNRLIGMRMTIRGSYPYGYGNMYGIGRGNVVGLKKHNAIQIKGDRAIIDGCQIKMESFGHVIYVQGGDRTTVRNTRIEGTLRPSNDCYNETDPGDLAKRFNYQLQWPENVKGLPIPRDHMINCTEDGIRAYKGAGDMIVENCVVKKTRGGIKLYMAKSAVVRNCQVMDCVIQGYSVPSSGTISNSSGNAAYGPLLYIHFDSHNSQTIDLKVFPAPHGLGDHPLAAIKGHDHLITFTPVDAPSSETLRPIIVGYPMRFDFLSVHYPEVPPGHEAHFAKYSPKTYKATKIRIDNATAHPVVLGALSNSNHVTSHGPIRDNGSENIRTTKKNEPSNR